MCRDGPSGVSLTRPYDQHLGPTTQGVRRMGKFDQQLTHWRDQHRITVEDLEGLQAGKRKIAEDTGEGWVDITDRWIEKLRNEVVVFAQLIEVDEKLNARNASRNPAESGV
jgi:hypothetical protein